jgi:transposase-like protein
MEIESFWGYAKNRLVKFHGIRKQDFIKYIKETEFRFNMRGKNMYKELLKILRKEPLN